MDFKEELQHIIFITESLAPDMKISKKLVPLMGADIHRTDNFSIHTDVPLIIKNHNDRNKTDYKELRQEYRDGIFYVIVRDFNEPV